jgi:hypothetical protein
MPPTVSHFFVQYSRAQADVSPIWIIGHLLNALIRQQMIEVKEAVNVEFHTVHVTVEAELLWSRIQARLALEPDRAKYSEDKREWMNKTLDFYNNFEWDLEVNNSHTSIEELKLKVITLVCERSKAFESLYQMRLAAPSTPKGKGDRRPDLFAQDDVTCDDRNVEIQV